MQDPDRDLVLRAQAGDANAFRKLVDRYYTMVYAAAYGILNHREEALDTAQEVFLKVFHEITGFLGKSKFKTWLYGIAIHAAIDQVRRRKPNVSLENAPELVQTQPGPREEASRNERARLVRRALEELTPEHRAVLVLREWEGLSYDEISEILGLELGTVMSRLFYARRKLAEHLGVPIKEKVL